MTIIVLTGGFEVHQHAADALICAKDSAFLNLSAHTGYTLWWLKSSRNFAETVSR